MAQVKKQEVRDHILKGAESLFADNGYVGTTMAAIAAASGVSKSNIYVYFSSKLEILWAISNPWLRQRFDALEADAHSIPEVEERVRMIFRFLWCELPAERNGFANNMMQALSTTSESDGYSRELLGWCEERFAEILGEALEIPEHEQGDIRSLAHIAFMAFDGFAVGQNLGVPNNACRPSADAMSGLLMQRFRQ